MSRDITGTLDDGTAAADHCDSWRDATTAYQGMCGRADSAAGFWTEATSRPCDWDRRLYCFED